MSPSENDLRAALHRGDGEPLDVGRVLAAGRAVRARRRSRLAAAGASVAAVAFAVTGGVLLGNAHGPTSTDDVARGGTSYPASGEAPGGGAAAAPSPADAAGSSAAPRGSASTGSANCPTSFPRRMLPGGGSPGQFGSDSPLFERTPVSITVCAYSGTGTVAGRTILTGRDATALRVSLESASRTAVSSCPVALPRARSLAFVGVDPAGRSIRVVTTSVQESYCDARTTNGTSVRYGWLPPESLADRFALLGVSVEPRITPSGKNIGSPVR